MTPNREQIEQSVANVLTNNRIDNVRLDVNDEELKYPVVVVHMVGETKQDPRAASDISVDVICHSILGREDAVDKAHYRFVDKIRTILSSRGSTGMYNMLWGSGLPVGQMYETVDNGTEIIEEEGGSKATTTINVNFRLVQ